MKKTTKGAIAAGSAALLLAGGAGTMAAWNASGDLAGGTVQSGTLSLTSTGTAGQWKLGDTAYTDQLLVPGDVLTYTAEYTIGAAGTNLVATLTAAPLTFAEDADAQLKGALTPTLTATVGDSAVTTITPENNNKVVKVVASITFDAETAGVVAQGQTAAFNAPTITLEQTSVA